MTRREDECESEAERVFTRASEAEYGVARERDAEREAVSDAEREVVREAALEGINMFDGADDADEDDVPGHRDLETTSTLSMTSQMLRRRALLPRGRSSIQGPYSLQSSITTVFEQTLCI